MVTRRRDWFRYWVVDWVAERTWALMSLLLFACVLLVTGITALVVRVTPDDAGGGEWHTAWQSLLLVLDPGTIANDESEHQFWYRVFALSATIGGILIVSTLIGVLTTALNDKLVELRRGRSVIGERGHLVVLGWSDAMEAIVEEIAEAGDRRPCLVVLDPDPRLPELVEGVMTRMRAKVRLDLRHVPADWRERRREVARKLRVLQRLRVIYRIGDPKNIDDLDLISLETAEAVIVPRPVGADPDARVLTTLLAIAGRAWPAGTTRPPLVAVISSAANVAPARTAIRRWSNKGELAGHIIDAEMIVARVLVQSLRYPGVSVVCRELLSFEGIEIRQPDDAVQATVSRRLAGMTYGAALHAFDRACLIGIQRGERYLISPFGGTSAAGPAPSADDPDELTIRPDDRPILIAYGSGSYDMHTVGKNAGPSWREEHLVAPAAPRPARPDRILVLGWNGRVGTIIDELARVALPGSTMLIVGPGYDEKVARSGGNLSVGGYVADPAEHGVLADLARAGTLGNIEEFTSILILAAPASTVGIGTGDERSGLDDKVLITMLQLEQVTGEVQDRRIICELGDDGNRRLARTLAADDLVVGRRLVSTLAVQYAKNPHRKPLNHLVESLFHAGDEDVCLAPAGQYVQIGVEVTFGAVVEAARRRGQTAIGYRVATERDNYYRNDGVRLNPAKRSKLRLSAEDEVIVIARFGPGLEPMPVADTVDAAPSGVR